MKRTTPLPWGGPFGGDTRLRVLCRMFKVAPTLTVTRNSTLLLTLRRHLPLPLP